LLVGLVGWVVGLVGWVLGGVGVGVEVITPRPGEKFDAGVPFVNRAWYLKGQ
jgi:hypothetical protein